MNETTIPDHEHWRRNALACEHVLGWVGVGIRRVVDTSGSGCVESNIWRGLKSNTTNDLSDVPAFHRSLETARQLQTAIALRAANTTNGEIDSAELLGRYTYHLWMFTIGESLGASKLTMAPSMSWSLLWALLEAQPWQIRDAALLAVGVQL